MIPRARLTLPLVVLSLAVAPQRTYAQWTSNGTLLCDATNQQYTPQIVSDGAGGAIVAWRDLRNGTNFDIYAQHVLASGVVDPVWTTANGNANGTVLCNAANDQDFPDIVSDGRGGAIVAWEDYRGGQADVYAQHVLPSGVVDPAWTAANGNANGTLLCNAIQEQSHVAIAADGAGGAIVTWHDWRNSGSTSSDIYAQRVRASGTVDPAWTPNGTLLCNAASIQYGPKIVADGAGGAIVTWYDYRSGSPDIYAQHVGSSGTVDPVWTTANGNANGTSLCNAAGDQNAETIVADGAGGAIVTWQDNRTSTDSDIYAQRVLASGLVDPAWTANGTLLCNAANVQFYPKVVGDGAGGAFVTWFDDRSITAHDAYAQHVLPSGVVDPAWTPNGTLLSSAASDQFEPTIVADGAGGAIVAWADYRSLASYDIYAQHLLTSGVDPTWTTNGTLLCNAANNQRGPTLIADGKGAIVTWYDARTGTNDIYAQRVYFCGNGAVAAASSPSVEQFAVRAPHPNPTHAEATISFDLATAQRVSVSVYDVTGQRVRTLVEDREFSAGSQNLVWDGTSDAGTPTSTGVYFVRVIAGGTSVARRIVFLR